MESYAPIITKIIQKDAFVFLGNENVVGRQNQLNESADFGKIWSDFFDKGGYIPIEPYAIDNSPVNVWFNDADGRFIYMQGLIVESVDKIPEGYSLRRFPASEYLMVTTEWLDRHDRSVGYEGNGRCNEYADRTASPEGYTRNDEGSVPLHRIEVEVGPIDGSYRYEVWVPLKRLTEAVE